MNFQRFQTPHVPVSGIPPPHAMYKIDSGIGVTTPRTGQSCPQPPLDLHPVSTYITFYKTSYIHSDVACNCTHTYTYMRICIKII